MSGGMLRKAAVLAALRDAVRAQCDAAERVAAMARDEASSDETRSEGKYDTRATEASFLARGQAERVEALRAARSWLALQADAPDAAMARVGVGALVELTLRGRTELVYVAPMAAAPVEVDGRQVRVIVAASPLGQALDDAAAGDDIEVDGPQGIVEGTVRSVQ